MEFKIKKIRIASKKDWDRIWAECEYATYFHSREWAEIWQNYTGSELRPLSYFLKFSDDTTAILPLMWYSPGQKYFSTPATAYGGLISLDSIDTRHFITALDYVRKYLGTVFVRVNPFGGNINTASTPFPFNNDETQVLFLKDNTEKLMKKWSKGHKSAVSKAMREGVTVNLATSLGDWRDYYEMYESSLIRWGDRASSRYAWKLFESMHKRSSPHIRLWLAGYKGQPIAGAICLYASKHVVYWHGAAFNAYFNVRPVQLLLYEIITKSIEQGLYWFDFNPSGNHEGVKSFKQGFGPIEMSCPWVELEKQKSDEGLRGIFRRLSLKMSC